jgi:hypothetical protein
MTFELTTATPVKLQHVNLRPEKHGDESVRAIDVKFALQKGNEVLDLFHPKLRAALYWNQKEQEQRQERVVGVAAALPDLIFSELEPVKWDLELVGAKVVIDYGLGPEAGSSIELCDCKVNAFVFECHQGGTVDVTFRVQTSNFPDGALDKLSKKLNQETAIQVLPGEPARAAIDGTEGHPALKAAKPKKEKTGHEAGDAFSEAHGESTAH